MTDFHFRRFNPRAFATACAVCLYLLIALSGTHAQVKSLDSANPEQAERGWLAINGKQGVIEVQRKLNSHGYCVGKPDGAIGPRTRAAVRAFKAHSPGWNGAWEGKPKANPTEEGTSFITGAFVAALDLSLGLGGANNKCGVSAQELAGTFVFREPGTSMERRFKLLADGRYHLRIGVNPSKAGDTIFFTDTGFVKGRYTVRGELVVFTVSSSNVVSISRTMELSIVDANTLRSSGGGVFRRVGKR